MNDLVQTLLSIKSPYDSFIGRPELIEGYTEEEIKQIEQKYNISIHGQFKELLMTMGRCSGGLLTGKSLFIYNKLFEPNGYFFGLEKQEEWQNDDDIYNFKKQINKQNLIEKQFFEFAENDSEVREKVYFLLTNNPDDIIYCWDYSDSHNETVYPYGSLFEFLCYCRKNEVNCFRGDEYNGLFESLTTGRLL